MVLEGGAMSTSLMSRDKFEAKKKGLIAASAWGGTVLFAVAGWTFPAVAAAGGAAYFTYKWFMFRAKRGMRF
jgi:hypothetical protein